MTQLSMRRKIRLLFIPEDAVARHLAEEQSENLKFEYEFDIRFANTLEEARTQMVQWSPSVVVMDMYCDHIDALSFLAEWRDGPSEFVALATHASSELVLTLRERGASSLVTRQDSTDDVEMLFREICSIAPTLELSSLAYTH